MFTIEGNLVNIDSIKRGRIEIGDDGLITSVGETTGKADLLLKNELIFPGFIDLHVHARECADHSQDYKEDFISAGQAAVNGGVVAFAEMPNNPVPPINDASYKEKLALTKKSVVDIVLYAATNPSSVPLNTKVPYKVYISKSVGDLFFDSFEQLDNFLQNYQGQNISFHCEDPKILKSNIEQPTHEQRRPAGAEIFAVEFALQMVEKHNLTGRICHVSTIEAVKMIVDARNKGIKVTCEIAPHHLYFDETMMTEENRKMFQVNPPIRQSQENRLALILALKNGDIDFLATDHAPHSLEEKKKGMSGLTHLDTYGAFITWLIKEHQFSPSDIARVCSYNPANFINSFVEKKYGKIEQGFVGSLSVIDLEKPTLVEKKMLKTKAGWSPFEGVVFPGSVTYTIIKGRLYKNVI